MQIAANVLQEAHLELMTATRRTMLECDIERFGLSLDDHTLQFSPAAGGLGLEVRREDGLVDVLQIEADQLVDGTRRRITSPDAYFGGLVVELVREQ